MDLQVLEATKEFTDGKSFNFWLGITDEDEEGKFKYQSDDKFVDENFGNGKPAMPWFAGKILAGKINVKMNLLEIFRKLIWRSKNQKVSVRVLKHGEF